MEAVHQWQRVLQTDARSYTAWVCPSSSVTCRQVLEVRRGGCVDFQWVVRHLQNRTPEWYTDSNSKTNRLHLQTIRQELELALLVSNLQNGDQIFGICKTLLQYSARDSEAGEEDSVQREGSMDSNHTVHLLSMLSGMPLSWETVEWGSKDLSISDSSVRHHEFWLRGSVLLDPCNPRLQQRHPHGAGYLSYRHCLYDHAAS